MKHTYNARLPDFLAGIEYPVIDHLGVTKLGRDILYFTSDAYATIDMIREQLDPYVKVRGFLYEIQTVSPYSKRTIRVHLYPPAGWNSKKQSSYAFYARRQYAIR